MLSRMDGLFGRPTMDGGTVCVCCVQYVSCWRAGSCQRWRRIRRSLFGGGWCFALCVWACVCARDDAGTGLAHMHSSRAGVRSAWLLLIAHTGTCPCACSWLWHVLLQANAYVVVLYGSCCCMWTRYSDAQRSMAESYVYVAFSS
jgi:hypothetical protein